MVDKVKDMISQAKQAAWENFGTNIEAISYLKSMKSAGNDKMTSEMFKNLGQETREALTNIFNQAWKRGRVTDIFKKSIKENVQTTEDNTPKHSFQNIRTYIK